jgi:hypothetical protein
VPHTKTCEDISIRMLIKTATAFFVPDEEGRPEMLKAVSAR